MSLAVITGSAGLIGSESVAFFHQKGFEIEGIDNNLRKTFYGEEGSTIWKRQELLDKYPRYRHHDLDIRDQEGMDRFFKERGREIQLVIHTAAQPSHDWAATNPHMDFTINAQGTLNLLESVRRHCPEAVFIFTSTNKVYGDHPNTLPLEEREWRYEIKQHHPYFESGIDESMSLDRCLHSLFGVSKTAADLMVQEYGRNFQLKTVCFRGGCLTGPDHSGVRLHGFLSYLVKCALTGTPYTIMGYKGKQVRDNIHSYDLVSAFWHYFQNPRPGEVYNIGGSRHSNCSVLEAIMKIEQFTGKKMNYQISPQVRSGDHQWWISDIRKFQGDYPHWQLTYDIDHILREMIDHMGRRVHHLSH